MLLVFGSYLLPNASIMYMAKVYSCNMLIVRWIIIIIKLLPKLAVTLYVGLPQTASQSILNNVIKHNIIKEVKTC